MSVGFASTIGGYLALQSLVYGSKEVYTLWSSAGLRERLVDLGAYAGCTVDQILIGTQFNRGIRAYTLVYEALMTLWLSAFFSGAQRKDTWPVLKKKEPKTKVCQQLRCSMTTYGILPIVKRVTENCQALTI
jgi:hypothetical protein